MPPTPRRGHLALLLPLLTAASACDGVTAAVAPRPPAPPLAAMTTAAPAEPAVSTSAPATTAAATRGEVVLVELGPPFPADLRAAVEEALRDELAVEVVWHERIPLPRAAWYAPRKRWRADVILEHLLTLEPDAPASTRVLGLTTKDISTTKGKFHDWGVFGLGYMPGQAAVIRVATTAVHEVGHTFGLDHCPEAEARCPMQDAEGGIENTDSSTGHLGPECRAKLEAEHPLRVPSRGPVGAVEIP
jgi:archaemetzincin